jgi:23S rRNA pseudouridine2457 synthase
MSRIVIFNKPFRVLSQFRESGDSEGLLILSDDGRLVQKITHPRFRSDKTYQIQVEGEPAIDTVQKLCDGVALKDGVSRPAKARLIEAPAHLWPRDPPIRYRASTPTSWLELTITEGRNRQVRPHDGGC